MHLLVTGGAGYIGSHTVHALVEQGYQVTVLDNLEHGHQESLPQVENVQFVKGSTSDSPVLDDIFKKGIDGVIHFAAYAYVGESSDNPLKYYQNNVANPLELLRKMQQYGVKRFVFSSTCATYGIPEEVPIRETEKQSPINPYGNSKWMFEKVLQDCESAWGLKSICLRYFNASGASLKEDIGEDHTPETHLIPLVLQAALGQRDQITVFGTDYDTNDGTCIRDYIHVDDLASAHIHAFEYLQREKVSNSFNIGTGKGVSVQEIIDVAKLVTEVDFKVVLGERRVGDPDVLVADVSKANQVLGWEAEHKEVKSIMSSAWEWHKRHPKGYQKAKK